MRTRLRHLCPARRPYIRPAAPAAHLRFYSAEQAQSVPRRRTWNVKGKDKWQHKEQYPRITRQDAALDIPTFRERYKTLGPGESQPDDEVVVRGMFACKLQVDLTHAMKEEYGRFGPQAQNWDSLTCLKTIGLCHWIPIDCSACLIIVI